MDPKFLDHYGNPDPDKIGRYVASLSDEEADAFIRGFMAEMEVKKDLRSSELVRMIPREEIKDLLAIQGAGRFSRQVSAQTKRAIASGTADFLVNFINLIPAFLGILLIAFLFLVTNCVAH